MPDTVCNNCEVSVVDPCPICYGCEEFCECPWAEDLLGPEIGGEG